MSSLPRNVRAKNANTRKKYGAAKEAQRKAGELSSICEKHNVGELSLTSCKYATEEGLVSFIEHKRIRGNMRAGIMVIKASAITPASDLIYDVVEVIKIKQKKDEEKRKEEEEKARTELERLQKADAMDTLPEGGEKHEEMVKKLTEGVDHEMGIINQESVDQDTKEILSDDMGDEEKKSGKKSIKEKKEEAIKQANKQLAQKLQNEGKNKHHRNFMKDLRSKFNLIPISDAKYFEVKMESSSMIIEDATVHKLIMPSNVTDTYLLIIGDLQMKTAVLRKIDPTYGTDKLLQDRTDFLERIKAKENAKITEHKEDVLDEEFDDLDALGISSEEDEVIPESVIVETNSSVV